MGDDRTQTTWVEAPTGPLRELKKTINSLTEQSTAWMVLSLETVLSDGRCADKLVASIQRTIGHNVPTSALFICVDFDALVRGGGLRSRNFLFYINSSTCR